MQAEANATEGREGRAGNTGSYVKWRAARNEKPVHCSYLKEVRIWKGSD